MASNGDIINLNVGGTKFSTSRHTLTWIPDTFFSSLLSGRIASQKDESGAIFVDRDPGLFKVILNYLRTKEVHLRNADSHALKHEAEFYGIAPLVKRLILCEDLEHSSCGDVLFHGLIPAPCAPFPKYDLPQNTGLEDGLAPRASSFRLPNEHPHNRSLAVRNQSLSADSRISHHTRQSSVPVMQDFRHTPLPSTCSLESKTGKPIPNFAVMDPLRVSIIKGHFNWLCVAYSHFVCLYRLKDYAGWNLAWTSPYLSHVVERIALNAKVSTPGTESHSRMIAAAYENYIQLWLFSDKDGGFVREIGIFNLTVSVDSLFFIGSQLVALSHTGKIGVWHAMTQNWQIQDVVPITSHDTAGSFLLLGCNNGSVYYIDMQKFPLRMKDNDLLVTELYKDPAGDKVTALSVYLTPKTSLTGNWIEIAYGTSAGTVRVIVQHPETVGQGPQLFQTFTVHRSPVTKVVLSEKHLVSVCSEYSHVRSWSVTRFRGMISTQPGSMPMASFKIVSIEDMDTQSAYIAGNDFGPYGEKDDVQVFVQKVIPETDQLFVRLSSSGKRVCVIKSVDGSTVSAFCVHECEGSSRMGSRPRRYLFTGHTSGSIQLWDLSTALELSNKFDDKEEQGGPTAEELIRLLDQCDLSNSRCTTPSVSPSPSLMVSNSHTPQSRRRVAMDQVAKSLELYNNTRTPRSNRDSDASLDQPASVL